jgi:tetratricopeptide (TPR) repeat protein
MKKNIFTLIFLFICQLTFGQDFQRKIFNYSQLNEDSIICPNLILEELDQVLILIENLQSERAAILGEEMFNKFEKCPALFEVYSWALFRSGHWMKSVQIIDSAIMTYGPNPDLILRRGNINIEMAELGVGIRNIDGNSIYLSKNKKLNFEESNFKKQNYLSALNDFKYIADTYQDRFHEIYLTGYIYQKLENYEESNSYLTKLLSNDDYADDITFVIVNNYIGQKKYDKAENTLRNLEVKYPRNSDIQVKFSELYEISGNQEKLKSSHLKAQFYSWVPEYCDLTYTNENYQLIRFFLEDNSSKEKIKKLKKIRKNNEELSIDLLITVLNTHSNHGNGVEEEAKKMLIKAGKSVVPKVILLMENAPSTCSVTKAASILAELKDPRGWEAMVNYLPRMENIPFTLIPPNVPEQIIKFDREKALITLLKWIKGQLKTEEQTSDNPMDELGGIFASTSIYSPLSVYKKDELKKAANNLKYTDDQIEKLLEKVYGKNK